MYAVGVLTRHLKHPTYLSCKAACRVLTFLSHHAAMSITYSGSKIYMHIHDKLIVIEIPWMVITALLVSWLTILLLLLLLLFSYLPRLSGPAILLASNPVHHQRFKHINRKHHWIHEMVTDHTVELVYVTTTEQRTDFLVKTLPGEVL